jgi:hypothetical protein
MRCVVELLDVKSVLFELDDGPFVIVDIAIVRSTKYSYYNWEFLCSIPLVHLVTIELRLVCT